MYLFLLLAFIGLVRQTHCTCTSFGIDFVNGGSYFIDNTEAVNFTFLTQFEGCDNEYIIPILVDPNENEYFCSQIATSPDDTSFLSTCPILQTAMFSGSWYIVVEGLTFAYVRTFVLTAGTPTTITATPTITIGVTSTPDAVTSTYTSTEVSETTLTPSTITVACRTTSKTITITPAPTITTKVCVVTVTKTTKTTTVLTSSTLTSTAICTPPPFPKAVDPRLQAPLYLHHTTISPAGNSKARQVRDAFYPKAAGTRFNLRRSVFDRDNVVVKRGPDSATVTITETTFSATTTSTTVLNAVTTSLTTYTTTVTTITPTPTTKCQGVTQITFTNTASRKTYTRWQRQTTTTYVTKTITICHTNKITMTPAALQTQCFLQGGSI